MPILSYKCKECEHSFEHLHMKINEKLTDCPQCNKSSLTNIIPQSFNFKIPGAEKHSGNGYTGKHSKLVNKLKGDKDYQEGHRKERQQQERTGLKNYKEDQKLKDAQSQFEKMSQEGMRMTKAEKEAIKKEFGIDKDFARRIKDS